MNLLQFHEQFPDEKSCRVYLKVQREKAGLTCDKCGCQKHYWLDAIEKWQCANCRCRKNLRSGTIMGKSKLSVKMWFMAMHLMTSTKKSFSALEMQRQLGMKFYEPVWYMMQKIRKTMGKRDSGYKLDGAIEIDDAFFEIVNVVEKDEFGNPKENKRGRGTKGKMKVLVLVESKPNPAQKSRHKKDRSMGFVKMKVMDELNAEGINYEVEHAVRDSAHVITDGYSGYSLLKYVVDKHTAMKVKPKEAGKKLPWVHTVISNAKRLFSGVHHSVSKDYIQNYLDEFCYKLNRRGFKSDLFERMIIAGVSGTWY